MNLQSSMLTNNFLPFIKPIASPFIYPQQNTSILPKLRQALSISLSRFTVCELQRIAKSQLNPIVQKNTSQTNQNVIQILSSDEEISNHNLELTNKKKENERKNQIPIKQIEEKTDISKDHFDCDKEFSLKSQQQPSNYVEKTHKIKKEKLNKTHVKLRKHKFSQIEENLDLTETALIRLCPISKYELNSKLEGLLQRKVLNWDETIKQKKERREIRMLQN